MLYVVVDQEARAIVKGDNAHGPPELTPVLRLYGPAGTFSPDPSVEEALELLTLPYDEYAASSGDLRLWYEGEGGVASRLILTMAPDGRFLVEHADDSGRTQAWASRNARSAGRVAMSTSGNAWDVGDRFLLPLEQVTVAVEEFCATGGRARQLDWEADVEISEPY
jgi:hypothetical protein